MQAGSDGGPALVLINSPKCWLRRIVRARRACTRSDRGSAGATGSETYLSGVPLLEYHSTSQGHRLPRHGEIGEGV